MDDPIITSKQAAELLGVSVRTAQTWIENGTLASWKTPGGHRRVRRSAVEALVEAKQTPVSTSAVIVVLTDAAHAPHFEAALAPANDYRASVLTEFNDTLLAIAESKPGLLVLDLNAQPYGLDLYRRLLSHPLYGHTRFVLVAERHPENGYHDGAREGRTVALGAADVETSLLQTVRALDQTRVRTGGEVAEMSSLSYPTPPNEALRISAVESTGLVGTAPEPAFDRVTALAARLLDVPMALVTLLDGTRQWFKSHHGVERADTPREWAFCNHAILQKDVFVVDDATADDRFRTNPLVTGDPGIRFYAGVPLVAASGYPLGTLCVLDRVPRRLDEDQARSLKDLAAIASNEIEARLTHRALAQTRAELLRRQRVAEANP